MPRPPTPDATHTIAGLYKFDTTTHLSVGEGHIPHVAAEPHMVGRTNTVETHTDVGAGSHACPWMSAARQMQRRRLVAAMPDL